MPTITMQVYSLIDDISANRDDWHLKLWFFQLTPTRNEQKIPPYQNEQLAALESSLP